MLAYDFKTGKRIWQTTIADASKGEFVAAAPIAWNGLVFIGNAGGDAKGGKGRMYALDAKTGKIVWEFYLVPKTEGDPTRGPQGPSPLDTSTWGNAPGFPISGGGDLDVVHARPGSRRIVRAGRQPVARLRDQRARGRESLYRLGRRARRHDGRLQAPFQARAPGLARLGRRQRACSDPHAGRQDAAFGRAQGRTSLWDRPRRQRPRSIACR